jgi:hypothetical protein
MVMTGTTYTTEPTTAYYTTDGSVRGDCGHKHRTVEAARRCLDKDQRGCSSQGGYSDRRVVAVDTDGQTRSLTESEYESLYDRC